MNGEEVSSEGMPHGSSPSGSIHHESFTASRTALRKRDEYSVNPPHPAMRSSSAPGHTGSLDNGDGFVDAGFEVEPDRGCLNNGDFVSWVNERHGGSLKVSCSGQPFTFAKARSTGLES